MSILDVKNVSHGFGSRVILENASFRLLKGEHVGLVEPTEKENLHF